MITQGLIDAHKVLCLCAISGDSLFLDDGFIELVARDACAMPAAVKCAKFYFFKGVPFLNELSLPDWIYLVPIALLSNALKWDLPEIEVRSLELGTN